MVPMEMDALEEILAIFDSHADHKSSLMMTNSYRGMILSQEIKPVAVDKHRAVFQAYDLDICAVLEGCVHLHSSLLPKPVKAKLRDLSIRQGMFSLTDFAYIDNDWKDRLHDRVQPKEPTYVSLHYRQQLIRSSMLDISIRGMGLLVCKSESEDLDFEPNASVCANFETSSIYRWAKLGGAVHYQQKLSKSISRLGIRLYPKIEQARQLEQYISKRKSEIMEELNQAYVAAPVHSGVEFQYF